MSRQVTYVTEKKSAMNLVWKCMMEETHYRTWVYTGG